MIKLTKIEVLAISGGDMECFCIPKGSNVFAVDPKPVRETLGDVDAATCAQACCELLVNAGWDFRGLDVWMSMSADDGQTKSELRAASGSC